MPAFAFLARPFPSALSVLLYRPIRDTYRQQAGTGFRALAMLYLFGGLGVFFAMKLVIPSILVFLLVGCVSPNHGLRPHGISNFVVLKQVGAPAAEQELIAMELLPVGGLESTNALQRAELASLKAELQRIRSKQLSLNPYDPEHTLLESKAHLLMHRIHEIQP